MTLKDEQATVLRLMLEAIGRGYALRLEPDGAGMITIHAFHKDRPQLYIGHTHCGIPEYDTEHVLLKNMERSLGQLTNAVSPTDVEFI